MPTNDGKAKSVIKYLDSLREQGKAAPGTIRPLKNAFTQVLRVVDGNAWHDTIVKSINVENYMFRFANLTMGKYSRESLTTYRSRVNRAIKWYLKFLEEPGWTPDVPHPTIPASTAASQQIKKTAVRPEVGQLAFATPSIPTARGNIVYPYPLLDGNLVYISLPVRLFKKDAKRIGSFVESIAIDDPTEEIHHER